jgi:hypothetical protein
LSPFISSATNLISNDNTGVNNLFVKNLQSGEVVRIKSAGTGSNPTTLDGELSNDGTRIAITTNEDFFTPQLLVSNGNRQ